MAHKRTWITKATAGMKLHKGKRPKRGYIAGYTPSGALFNTPRKKVYGRKKR